MLYILCFITTIGWWVPVIGGGGRRRGGETAAAVTMKGEGELAEVCQWCDSKSVRFMTNHTEHEDDTNKATHIEDMNTYKLVSKENLPMECQSHVSSTLKAAEDERNSTQNFLVMMAKTFIKSVHGNKTVSMKIASRCHVYVGAYGPVYSQLSMNLNGNTMTISGIDPFSPRISHLATS
ncbi:hypothetical protein KP509_24G042000 [Ceratopteris richardii]|nr:hypothetical protein KP509_24G042000 [Ceratopteris richardii]